MKIYTKSIFSFLLINLFVLNISAQDIYFPEAGTWQEKDPKSFNLDFSEAIQFAEANEYSESKDLRQAILKGFQHEPYHEILGPTKRRGGPAGIILKDGYLVAKWGDTKRVDMTFSVTKSFLSTTALLALDQNLIIDVEDPVINYVWNDTFEGEHNSKITWKHLLEQNSDWRGELWGSYDWADRPSQDTGIDDWRNRKLNEPGTHFKYNDVRVNVLAYSLLNVFRKPLPTVLKEEIMDPINASSSWRWFGYENSWTTIDGFKMQSVSGGGHSGGGMFINTEDMARFGLLFMNNGNWNGEKLISEDLIEEAIQPSATNSNYGYMWWLNADGPRQWKNIDKDIFYAAGFGGNFIIVDRKENLVIVTRWLEPSKIEEFVQKIYN
ncbi:serine hydrolase domain-containing protein [Salegentibacter agarivorans]|jgi:CubicO group peptidase (beta-lactamase class C family)|uniref:serine hydrolase domain-containing protein n=1 Tax=unclassified Salegentibacter TaxID=2633436 RepID=UPI00094A7342|nr:MULTISPECIES: serine hydrolase [unclassified Salegentibacter]APS39921.1 serine hydrolase [Salegentibacter sp. T436]MBO2545440.1 serine hydrolase [Salegentibacter sp. BDJ18]|tara:strand:- start:388 stop:1530 length:1143 start_codon:yes stop_codon:yes gene_type:complete